MDAINERCRRDQQYPVVDGGDVVEAYMEISREKKVPENKLTKNKPLFEEDPCVKTLWHREGVADDDQYVCAPGVSSLIVGKAHEQHWRNPHMLVYVVDVMDVFEFLYGKYAHHYEWYIGYECKAHWLLDWNSGHAEFKENALNAKAMSTGWGGETNTVVRDTVIEKTMGYLGPYDGVLRRRNHHPFEYKLQKGETQTGAFRDEDKPPFYAPNTPSGNGNPDPVPKAPKGAKEYLFALRAKDEYDSALNELTSSFVDKLLLPSLKAFVRGRTEPVGRKRVAPTMPNKKKSILVAEASRLLDENVRCFIDLENKSEGYDAWKQQYDEYKASNDGFLGQAKGLKQYLFERGWIDPKRTYSEHGETDEHGEIITWTEEMLDDDGAIKTAQVSSSLRDIAAGLEDFVNEVSLVEQLIIDLGHTVDFPPKCHLEIAGEDIEYDWGYADHQHRHNINDENHANLRRNSYASIGPAVLTLERCRRYERVAYRYKMVYRKLHADTTLTEFEHGQIERLQKEMRSHRGVNKEFKALETGAFHNAGFL